jgi:hypothetical protein
LLETKYCPENSIMEMTESIVNGKKAVQHGEYALLSIGNSNTFYSRYQNRWLVDKSVDEMSFMSNSHLYKSINEDEKKIKNKLKKRGKQVKQIRI